MVALSILALTEDGSRYAFDTAVSLFRDIIRLAVPVARTNRIDFQPLREGASQGAVTGNMWKSTNPKHRQSQVELWRTIAAKVSEPNGYVMFHFDGDETWSNSTNSHNWRQFEALVIPKVQLVIRSREPSVSENELSRRLRRLVVFSPYYSIEAWLYQNTSQGRRICAQRHRSAHMEQFDRWERDRGQLDEIYRPKEVACLGSTHNRDLATSAFPRIEAASAAKSFAAAALSVTLCHQLVEDLERTASEPWTKH